MLVPDSGLFNEKLIAEVASLEPNAVIPEYNVADERVMAKIKPFEYH